MTGVLNCTLLCRVHAARLKRELVINVIRHIARSSMHLTHAKQLDAALAATWLNQKAFGTAKTMTLWWSLYKSAAAMVVDVDLFDQVISNMDTPQKVMSQLTTAVQSVLGRKLFGDGIFSVIQSH